MHLALAGDRSGNDGMHALQLWASDVRACILSAEKQPSPFVVIVVVGRYGDGVEECHRGAEGEELFTIHSQVLLLFSFTEQQPRSRQMNVGDRFSENMSVFMKSPQRV